MAGRRAGLLVGVAGAALGLCSAAVEQAASADYLAGATVGATLGVGRRHPRAAWLIATAALLAAAPFGSLPLGVALLAVGNAFCAGRWDGPRGGLAGLVALLAGLELNVLVAHDSAVPAFFLPVAAWGAGRALRERSLVAAQLEERARELEAEREAHASLSVRYERARIGSELHDIVAHAISVMVIQASAGQRLAARDPEATAETFSVIADAARQAEGDMGRLVALLGDEQAIGDAPDLTLVEELVARATGSGLDVTLRLEGERAGLPAPVVETAYRIVREGLTNALRYAAGAKVSVTLRGDRDMLAIEVLNDRASAEVALTGTGTGTGLQGLRDRVAATGGTLATGPTPEGGWRVSVVLPRRIAAGSHPSG